MSRHPIRDAKAEVLQTLIRAALEYPDMDVRDCTRRPYPTVELFMISGPRLRARVHATRRRVEIREQGSGFWWFAMVDGLAIATIDKPQATLQALRESMRWSWQAHGSPSVLSDADPDDDEPDDEPPLIIGAPSATTSQQPHEPNQPDPQPPDESQNPDPDQPQEPRESREYERPSRWRFDGPWGRLVG
jgi:hypothetical protein